jgi:hypothetical protein
MAARQNPPALSRRRARWSSSRGFGRRSNDEERTGYFPGSALSAATSEPPRCLLSPPSWLLRVPAGQSMLSSVSRPSVRTGKPPTRRSARVRGNARRVLPAARSGLSRRFRTVARAERAASAARRGCRARCRPLTLRKEDHLHLPDIELARRKWFAGVDWAPEQPLPVHRRWFSRVSNGYESAKLARSWGRCEGERSTPVIGDARQQFPLMFSRVGRDEAPRASGCFLPLPGKQLDRRRATERRPLGAQHAGTPQATSRHRYLLIWLEPTPILGADGSRGERLSARAPPPYVTPS